MIASAFPLLLAFWLFVGWRVRVERGHVRSPMRAYLLEQMAAVAAAPELRTLLALKNEGGTPK